MNLELTTEQVELILRALAAQPFSAVAPLIGEIQQQAQPQVQVPEEIEEPTDG